MLAALFAWVGCLLSAFVGWFLFDWFAFCYYWGLVGVVEVFDLRLFGLGLLGVV